MPAGKTRGANNKRRRNKPGWMLGMVWPLGLIGIFLGVFTGGWMLAAPSSLLAAEGDAFQNLWSMTWVRQALVTGQDIYLTDWLFYPMGVSLAGHALNPLAGGLFYLLGQWLTVVQVYNVVLLAGFLLAGWTMYGLMRSIIGSDVPALAAGLIYAFSSSHLVQARDHLEMATIFWLPLWLFFLKKVFEGKRVQLPLLGLGTTTFLSWYTSPYWVVMELVTAVLLGMCMGRAWWCERGRTKRGLFVGLVLVMVLWIPLGRMIKQQRLDPLVGGHDPQLFSVDLAGFFVPDQYWWGHTVIDGFWQTQRKRQYEISAYVGYSVMVLAGWGLMAGYRRKDRWVVGLGVLAFLAGWWSLGPVIRLKAFALPLPSLYGLSERVLPVVTISGVPGRILVVVTMAISMLAGYGAVQLLQKKGGRRWLAMLLVVWVAEMKPMTMPMTEITIPGYVEKLATLPPKGAVIDALQESEKSLYYQTIHRHPLAWGYLSREPTSIHHWKLDLIDVLRRRDWDTICRDYAIAYVVTNKMFAAESEKLAAVYADDEVKLWALDCARE